MSGIIKKKEKEKIKELCQLLCQLMRQKLSGKEFPIKFRLPDDNGMEDILQVTGYSTWQGADKVTPNQIPHFDLLFPVFMPIIMGLVYYLRQRQLAAKETGVGIIDSQLDRKLKREAVELTINMAASGLGYEAGAAFGRVVFLLLHIVPHTWLVHLAIAVVASLVSAGSEVAATIASEKLLHGHVESTAGKLAKDFVVSFIATMIWYSISLLPMPQVGRNVVQNAVNFAISALVTALALGVICAGHHCTVKRLPGFSIFNKSRLRIEDAPPDCHTTCAEEVVPVLVTP